MIFTLRPAKYGEDLLRGPFRSWPRVGLLLGGCVDTLERAWLEPSLPEWEVRQVAGGQRSTYLVEMQAARHVSKV